MKRCPKCGRTFTEDGQKFCTHDGGALVPSAIDPNATVRGDAADPTATGAPDPNAMAPTQAISSDLLPPSSRPLDPYATMAAAKPPPDDLGSTETGPTNQPTSPGPAQVSAPLPHSTSAPLPPAISAQLPPPTAPPAPPLFVPPSPSPPPAKKSKMPLILAVLAVLLLVGLGGLAAGYFFVLGPMLEAQKRTVGVVPEEVNQNTNTNVDVPTPVQDDSVNNKTETDPPPFVPPADAVEFVNSSANLDGKLAEHYLDFSFYYPKSWQKDPQAGVPGATNFVNVQRQLSRNTPERFAVGWYASGGSLKADLSLYPELIEELSASLEKGFPDYRKLSEGETKVNSYDAYEFRFQSVSHDPAKGEITLWGRVIFLPPKSGANGATLFMFATSLQPEVTSADDVGVKGGLSIILESFRLGAQR